MSTTMAMSPSHHRHSRPLAIATAATRACTIAIFLQVLSKPSTASAAASTNNDDNDSCLIYLAESTIPGAGLGMFAGTPFHQGQLIGRNYGDAAFPTTDQDWHNSFPNMISKYSGDYHWPLTNYDWNAPDIGMEHEAEDVSVTVTGFGAAPNCHFRLLNVEEHPASYDNMGLDRYTDPGAGGSTPWFNRTSLATRDIQAGSELFVDYGPHWFLTRDGVFELVPVSSSYEHAQAFLGEYGKMLVGSNDVEDLVEENMQLGDEAQKDLWDIVKTFPYPSREREALPNLHKDAIRAIRGGIQQVEEENAIRDVEYLKEHGKCVDNIVPGKSTIEHAGRGAFATRFMPKGGLVAPAPVVHIADKSTTYMYAEMIGPSGDIVRNVTDILTKQIILNYCFGHPNSTLLLFPYSSNVAYINHHVTEYNAELRWATNFSFFHHEDWLDKSVEFLEDQWTSGLALEFIATRDIQPGEEVLINYGQDWQDAWDEHVKNWLPVERESDFNNLTFFTDHRTENSGKVGYIRADVFNDDYESPIRTMDEQKTIPYPHSVEMLCQVGLGHMAPYHSRPLTIPFFKREWTTEIDAEEPVTFEKCNVTERFVKEDDEYDENEEGGEHAYYYTVRINANKKVKHLNSEVHETHVITSVPWGAIRFKNLEYTSDVFLKHAFRHEMRIPDELFPKAWMNLIPKDEKE